MRLQSGARLGPYEILSPIGAGGMGEVYKARDIRLERVVAIKVLPEVLSTQPERRERFEREAREFSALPTQDPSLTAEGAILGTLQYMAPEQLEGKEADHRTDIFAFGAVLYEMLTGRKAFEGHTQASLIAAILERHPPAVSTIEPLCPRFLEHAIKRCLTSIAQEIHGGIENENSWSAGFSRIFDGCAFVGRCQREVVRNAGRNPR